LDLDRREKPQIGSDSESKWAKKAEARGLRKDERRGMHPAAENGDERSQPLREGSGGLTAGWLGQCGRFRQGVCRQNLIEL